MLGLITTALIVMWVVAFMTANVKLYETTLILQSLFALYLCHEWVKDADKEDDE